MILSMSIILCSALRPEDPRPEGLHELGSIAYSLGSWKAVPTDFPRKPSLWEKLFELPSNLAETFPEFYPFLKTARGHNAVASTGVNKMLQHFGYTISGARVVPTPQAETFKQVAVREDLRKALDILRMRQNEKVDGARAPGTSRKIDARGDCDG